MQVYKSRFTIGATGDEISLGIGEKVQFQLLDGKVVDIEISSERMTHNQCETYGYEAVFSDNGELGFADGKRIIGWEGKMETADQLDKAIESASLGNQ